MAELVFSCRVCDFRECVSKHACCQQGATIGRSAEACLLNFYPENALADALPGGVLTASTGG